MVMMPHIVAPLSSEHLGTLDGATDISQVPARYSVVDFYELMVISFLSWFRRNEGSAGEMPMPLRPTAESLLLRPTLVSLLSPEAPGSGS
jgi:hypothetical protein